MAIPITRRVQESEAGSEVVVIKLSKLNKMTEELDGTNAFEFSDEIYDLAEPIALANDLSMGQLEALSFLIKEAVGNSTHSIVIKLDPNN